MENEKYLFLCLDIEATGHDPETYYLGKLIQPYHEIVDLGAVLFTQECEVLRTFSQKVLPEHPERCMPNIINEYPRRAQNGEWENAVARDIAIWRLMYWCTAHENPKTIVGQNISFDWSFLAIAFAECKITADTLRERYNIHYAKTDTRSMAIQELWEPGTPFDPDDYSLRNGRLTQKLGIEDEPIPHEALNGAMKCYEVFKKLREMRGQR